MDLRDYPRPAGDTGIGFHWNAGFATAVGLGHITDFWLPEIKAMGVKWVKIAHHDGALSFAELLLKNDIMPVVRLYRPQPNPGTLGQEAIRWVKDYVSAGVRYFEFNNEPDLGVEWQNHEVPPNALQVVAHNAIIDMESVLGVGGFPGIPAVAVGCQWDIVGEICRQGRRDLLREPVWVALHNYSLNHPLDYPLDPGNQQGAPYSREYYDRLAAEQWDGSAWGGWSLERINQERRDHANPGDTAFEDPSCWRAYERHDQLVRRQIGRSLPILATENGYLVGERQDPRYPATTPALHTAQSLEATRIMMRTSQRFEHAPDYYFCTAFWLLANYRLGHWAPAWEPHAWYSDRWPNGALAAVSALKSEPKQARSWRGDGGIAGQVSGMVLGGADLTISLERTDPGSDTEPAPPDGWRSSQHADADGRFVFADVPLGRYRVSVEEAQLSQEIQIAASRPHLSIEFDATDLYIVVAESSIRGHVRCGAGLTIRLARPGDGWHAEQIIAEDGSYFFGNLTAGSYVLMVGDTGVARAGLELDGRNALVVDLEAPGWWWESTPGGAGPGFSILRCRVTGRTDLPVHLSAPGWPGLTQRTGSKAEFGAEVCEFAPLGAGSYTLYPEGIGAEAQVQLAADSILWVTFTETVVTPARASAIRGHVRFAAGRTLRLIGPEGERHQTVAADHSYAFEGLPAGVYSVVLAATDVSEDRIVLDGVNHAEIELEMPPLMRSAIFGVVIGAAGGTAGMRVRVLQPLAGGVIDETPVGGDGSYRVEGLPSGLFAVQVLSAGEQGSVLAYREDVGLDGSDQERVDFALSGQPQLTRYLVEDAGPGPGFSIVRCQVLDAPDVQVRLWASGWQGATARTGTKQEYGPDVCEFAPLGAGIYFLEPAGLGVQAVLQLSRNRVAWVRFMPAPAQARSVEEAAEAEAPAASISGSVFQSEGEPVPAGVKLAVRLMGPDGQHTAPVIDGKYLCSDLLPGSYKVTLLLTSPSQYELAHQDDVWLEEAEQQIVDLEWSPVVAARGRVIGRLQRGEPRRVVLAGPGGPFMSETAEDGAFAFSHLFPGSYELSVPDAAGDVRSSRVVSNILVDGDRDVRVELGEEKPKPTKDTEHYLLVGSIPRLGEDFVALLRYVARFQPTIGRDEVLARQARHVTILGGVDVISNLTEQSLRMSGCEVNRICEDLADRLTGLLEANVPY